MTTTPTFRRGGDAAAEASKTSSFSGGRRIHFFSLADGESAYLRFITDQPDWIYVAQHISVPTKNKPSDFDGNWPPAMPAVCRKDEAFKAMYDGCYICDSDMTNKWGKKITAPIRIWALAVVRDEVIGDGTPERGGPEMTGKRLGCTDRMVEVDELDKDGKPTGAKIFEREYVILNFANRNFFGGLNTMYGTFGTVCDRDYLVRRTGSETDTQYNFVNLERTDNLLPGTEKWEEKYLKDLDRLGIDLAEIVAQRASDDYYKRFFIPDNEASSSSSAPAPQREDSPEDAERLAAMRERVRGHAAAKPDID